MSMLDGGAPTLQESDLQQSLRAQRKLFQDVVETTTNTQTAPSIPKKAIIPKSGRKSNTPVPAKSRKTFYINTGYPTNRPIARALRIMGWRRVESRYDAQLIYAYTHKKHYYKDLKPWQRYNHVPKRSKFNSKDDFQYYMRRTVEIRYGLCPKRIDWKMNLRETNLYVGWRVEAGWIHRGS